MEIIDNFTSKRGITYNIRDVRYTKDNFFGNLGTLVNETNREVNDYFKASSFSLDNSGVYIYKSKFDPKKALRIYKSCSDYGFDGDRDDILISKLLEYQDGIKLTEFPVGVVTKDGCIIGQEIIYYEDYIPIYDVRDAVSDKELIDIYRKCLIILKELDDNGIYYLDVHGRNFLVNKDMDIKLIDFEYDLMKFDKKYLVDSLSNFTRMVNLINKRSGRDVLYDQPCGILEAFSNLDKLESELEKRNIYKQKTLVKN